MSNEELLRRYQAGGGRLAASNAQGLAVPPTLKTAVVTCMDARIDVFALFGLALGEVHVLRNAGGVVTDDVVRSPSFHGGHLQTKYEVVYVIAPDRTLRRKEATRTLLGTIEFDIVALKRLPTAYKDENPYATQPSSTIRETYQARLAADVERQLIADPTLQAFQGLGVSRLEVTSDDRSAEETAIEGWACAFLRVVCEYRYRFDTP